MKNIGTIPNLISLTRFVGGILFIPVNNLLHFSNFEIILIIICAWLTDLLDGWVARRMNQVSDAGKSIDPIADKVFMFALILTFYLSGKVDLFYISAVIGRDVLILAGGLYISRKTGTVLPSNLLGKICVFSIGIYFLSVLFSLGSVADIFKWISIILIFTSLIIYFQRAAGLIKDLKYVQQN
jgi:CDP-diacylglycerol--glycerol-3-phosphate 3-phosphatidyltransferase